MTKIKKVVFLSGTRADFGKLRPLIDKVVDSPNFEYYIFVTGMHTLSKFGRTYYEIQKHGYQNFFVFMNQSETTDMDIILSNTITGFSNFIKEISPDMIVIHGDRLEALAGAIVGSFNNILVSHIEGGEVSGTLDEPVRHAITKLSQIHFVANEDAKRRLIRMGESEKNTFVIGSPDIEVMKSENLPTLDEVKDYYEISFEQYSIFIFHPVTSELEQLPEQIDTVVNTLLKSEQNYIVVYPNNDKGSEIIIDKLQLLKNNKNFRIFPSIRFEYFLTLLKNSNFIIGNSSTGIRESEVYAIPSINIGSRQHNRHKHEGIINVNCADQEILDAIKKTKDVQFEPTNYFGNGQKTSELFIDILNNEEIWSTSIQKHFVD